MSSNLVIMNDGIKRRDRREYMRAYRARMSPEQKQRAYEQIRRWKRAHPEKVGASQRKTDAKTRETQRRYLQEWRASHPGADGKYCKAQRIRILQETVEAYGGKCSCCGETRILFLTIDHVNNDGATERRGLGDGPSAKSKKGRAGINFYRHLKKAGFPQDRYRLLCFNCNCGRARNDGVCPHQEAF